jgi:hypothetical protein
LKLLEVLSLGLYKVKEEDERERLEKSRVIGEQIHLPDFIPPLN